ncbi:hypothetical protein NADE_008156 [Nannochloris sp. 'desiccata']|nr:hypothetical protein KSW81_000055 [Chlorella desiccata (nom. nud.)]KAH7619878.1 hypothetical protein NADE_008156 [Chlorella desiccata (nom. nud.)]
MVRSGSSEEGEIVDLTGTEREDHHVHTWVSRSLWGTALSSVIGGARVVQVHSTLTPQKSADGTQDRAYHLHYSRGQQRGDFFSEAGIALGGTAALISVSPAAAVVAGRAAAGAVAGMLAHTATSFSKDED